MIRIMTAMIMCSLMACAGVDDAQTTDEPDGTNSLGTTVVSGLSAQTLVHDGLVREFQLYVPASYDGTVSVPLVLNFHGNGGTSEGHMSTADMRDVAESDNFIVIYPQGTLLDGSAHWNSMMGVEGNKSNTDDLGFVDALLTLMSSSYAIDSSRVYATGYSNGGDFSYTLGCYLSDRITGIAPVSSLMTDIALQPCSPTHPTTVMIFNGTGDYVRPYEGYDGYLESVDDAAAFWVSHNNIEEVAEVTAINNNGLSVERSHYAGGDSGTTVDVFKVIGGDHIWFDFEIEGTHSTKFIWDVLSQYDQNGLRDQ